MKEIQEHPELTPKLVEMTRIRLESARAALEDHLHLVKRHRKQLDAKETEMEELLKQLRGLKFDIKNIAQVIQQLVKIINYLSELSAQWSQLTAFFISLSQRIRAFSQQSLKGYLGLLKTAQSRAAGRELASEFMKSAVMDQAVDVGLKSYVIEFVSGLFVDVTNHHILDRLSALNQLILVKSEADFKTNWTRLETDCIQAKQQISARLEREFQTVVTTSQTRLRVYEQLKEMLPPAPVADQSAMRAGQAEASKTIKHFTVDDAF